MAMIATTLAPMAPANGVTVTSRAVRRGAGALLSLIGPLLNGPPRVVEDHAEHASQRQIGDQHETFRLDVAELGQLHQPPPGHERLAPIPERHGHSQHRHDAEEPDPAVAAEGEGAGDDDNEDAEPEVVRGQNRALVAADPLEVGRSEEERARGRRRRGQELVEGGAAQGKDRIRPDGPGKVGRAGQGEPHRIGQQDDRGDSAGDKAADGMARTRPERGEVVDGPIANNEHEAHEARGHHDEQDLGPDEELHGDEEPGGDPDGQGGPSLSEDQFVQAGPKRGGTTARPSMM